MVGAELHFEAVGSPAERREHHAGVVHQDVYLARDAAISAAAARTADRDVRSSDTADSRADGSVPRIQVMVSSIAAALRAASTSWAPAAASARAASRPQTGRGAGDHTGPPGQVDTVDDPLRGQLRCRRHSGRFRR